MPIQTRGELRVRPCCVESTRDASYLASLRNNLCYTLGRSLSLPRSRKGGNDPSIHFEFFQNFSWLSAWFDRFKIDDVLIPFELVLLKKKLVERRQLQNFTRKLTFNNNYRRVITLLSRQVSRDETSLQTSRALIYRQFLDGWRSNFVIRCLLFLFFTFSYRISIFIYYFLDE